MTFSIEMLARVITMLVFIKEIDTSSIEMFLLNTIVYKLMLLQFILLYKMEAQKF